MLKLQFDIMWSTLQNISKLHCQRALLFHRLKSKWFMYKSCLMDINTKQNNFEDGVTPARCQIYFHCLTQPAKLNLDKKLYPKQKLFRPSILMPNGPEKLEKKILPHGKKELPPQGRQNWWGHGPPRFSWIQYSGGWPNAQADQGLQVLAPPDFSTLCRHCSLSWHFNSIRYVKRCCMIVKHWVC